MRRWIPELVALPLLPLLVAQGYRTRRITPRLPEAQGPFHDIAGAMQSGPLLSLLAIGESPVAGVGVNTHHDAITGQLALALSDALACPVAWCAHGKNGITVSQGLQHLVPALPPTPVDIALIAFGVNDTTAFRPATRWRRDLHNLIEAVDARCMPTCILLSGVPPLSLFPALPQPLRSVMGMKARALDAVARDLAAALPRVHHVPLAIDVADTTLMASDGYHPSEKGCTLWAGMLSSAYTRLHANAAPGA